MTLDGVPARQADLLGCFALGPTGSIALEDGAALSLSLAAFSFNKGSSKTLELRCNGGKVSAKKAKWKSANASIAKVSSSGKITAKKKGVTTVTAAYQGMTAACRVVVTDIKQVKKVKLGQKSLTVPLFGTAKLTGKVEPSNATYPQLTWTSSNPAVVSVDETGRVAGLALGSATVTAASNNGKTASCKVTVQEIPVKKVDFDRLYVTLRPGETFAATVKI